MYFSRGECQAHGEFPGGNSELSARRFRAHYRPMWERITYWARCLVGVLIF